ncbi:receptor-like protein 37 [Quercus suber]|uniref:Receptor-like protein 37 n=1 Tax=Quercus suber TaxID=58331 RepID=A0AAW0LGX5_QUESU
MAATLHNFQVSKLSNQSAGTLSPLISRLSQLTYLDFSDNSFFALYLLPFHLFQTSKPSLSDPTLPVSIANLKSAKLKSLDSLDLSHNSLTGFLPNSINSLSNLRRFDLSYNKLIGSLPPNLLELALKHNSLFGYLSNSSFDRLTISWKGWNSANTHSRLTRVEVWKPTGGNSNLVAIDLGFNGIDRYLPVNFVCYPLLASLNNEFCQN